MIDLDQLWDFDDPSGSEERLRAAAASAPEPDAALLRTQVVRALGLQGRLDEALELLTTIDVADPEVATRVALEHGRVLRSAGDAESARPHFGRATELAETAGLERLMVDALHMEALVAPLDEQIELTQRALAVARDATDPRARDWDAPLFNNLGMAHADAGNFEAALSTFELAVEARRRIGADRETRVARWMVAWALRNLGRREEALGIQRELKRELESLGEQDPYVDEEIALLTEACP